MKGWEIIQSCELAPDTGLYGKRKFISAINELSPEEFNKFCRSYLHLLEFYHSSQGAWITDNKHLINKHHTSFWRMKEIDFDAPVTFRRVE